MLKSPPKWLVDFLAKHTPHCDRITQLVSESMDRPLPLGQRIKVRAHFFICIWCERYAKQIRLLHDAIHKHSTEVVPAETRALSPEARERIKRSLVDPRA